MKNLSHIQKKTILAYIDLLKKETCDDLIDQNIIYLEPEYCYQIGNHQKAKQWFTSELNGENVHFDVPCDGKVTIEIPSCDTVSGNNEIFDFDEESLPLGD